MHFTAVSQGQLDFCNTVTHCRREVCSIQPTLKLAIFSLICNVFRLVVKSIKKKWQMETQKQISREQSFDLIRSQMIIHYTHTSLHLPVFYTWYTMYYFTTCTQIKNMW